MTRWFSEPARAPVRRVIQSYSTHFDTLIHAVKNELVERLGKLDASVSARNEMMTDQLALHTTTLSGLRADLDRLTAMSERALGELTDVRDHLLTVPPDQLQELVGAGLSAIDGPASAFLNHTQSWNGPLAEAGLFINHPFLVEWQEGSAGVRLVNERIIEQPFVFAALADLAPGARVLDVGGGESIVGLALASLGHRVTVIEPRGYPFAHPNLMVYEGPIETFEADEPFDATIVLSTIEHLGIGHYADGTNENPTADLEAMKIIRELTAPGGRLVLTTPYGPAQVDDFQRIYDRQGLLALIEDWEITSAAVGRKIDELTWEVEATALDAIADLDESTRVAMLVAKPRSGS